jgi:hypothetical protein
MIQDATKHLARCGIQFHVEDEKTNKDISNSTMRNCDI